MRILHTADWHLEDRLGRVDRTPDLRRAVERVAQLCAEQRVDVLLIAGDLFCDKSVDKERMRDALHHLRQTFHPFLQRGGTILAITGNHDSETACSLLREAMLLAAPGPEGRLVSGRFYLAHAPLFARLADATDLPVQFALLPYPTKARYLDATAAHTSRDQEHAALHGAAVQLLRDYRHRQHEPALPTVLAAHLHIQGSRLHSLYKLSEREDVLFSALELPAEWDYLALGHIHKPQCLLDRAHIRYSGSLERLNLGESDDAKGCILFDLGPAGRRGEPEWLPLAARPIYEVAIRRPQEELPQLRERYPDAQDALVKLDVVYRADRDNRQAILEELERIFPRWYERTCREESTLVPRRGWGARPSGSFEETVTEYVKNSLGDDPELPELLQMLDGFLKQEQKRDRA
jgi:DNA repair protein SbcD/Mre11